MNATISLKANFEMDLKRLSQENLRLREALDMTNVNAVRDIESTKNKLLTDQHSALEHLKKNHSSNMSLYEEQLRSLRHIVEDREKEICTL